MATGCGTCLLGVYQLQNIPWNITSSKLALRYVRENGRKKN